MGLISPVLVFDFQSLYPSIMISHNLCYSTCLGKVDFTMIEGLMKVSLMPYTRPEISQIIKEKLSGGMPTNPAEIHQLFHKYIYVAPNKVAYVRRSVRIGLIPQILEELLQTRIMFKQSSKLYNHLPRLQRTFEYRQMALKLFMNVMYGYTGASHSGRMPSSLIADSIVGTARLILEQCIKWVDQQPGLETIYCDTDSIFVVARGFTADKSFKTAAFITKEITKMLPHPVELKFEKVLRPFCILAKKRYMGWRTVSLSDPGDFLSKGVEISRRDGCPALVQTFKEVILSLFKEGSLSEAKRILCRVWSEIEQGSISPLSLMFAKAVRLGSYRQIPAAGYAAIRRCQLDPRLAAKHKERVKYLVLYNPGSQNLRDMVIPLEEYIKGSNLDVNTRYYTLVVLNKPIGRCLGCLNINIDTWFDTRPDEEERQSLFNLSQLLSEYSKASCEPREHLPTQTEDLEEKSNSNWTKEFQSITNFVNVGLCLLCGRQSTDTPCEECATYPTSVAARVKDRIERLTKEEHTLSQGCHRCQSYPESSSLQDFGCINFDCTHWYERMKAVANKSLQTPGLSVLFEKHTYLERSAHNRPN